MVLFCSLHNNISSISFLVSQAISKISHSQCLELKSCNDHTPSNPVALIASIHSFTGILPSPGRNPLRSSSILL